MKKGRLLIVIILAILILDQVLKFYIKLNFELNTTRHMAGNWFQLFFVENPGMAYGWKFGGTWGKMALTIFRLLAVIAGTIYLMRVIKKEQTTGFLVCAALIYAGAMGNLIDSCFYGLIFDKGMVYNATSGEYLHYAGLAKLSSDGYSSFLHGNVVDMLYFPVIRTTFPDWVPVWGGRPFEFFQPIFNIADASISMGVITLMLFQNRFIPQKKEDTASAIETSTVVDDNTQVS